MSSTRGYWERICGHLASFLLQDLARIAICYADDSVPAISELVDALREGRTRASDGADDIITAAAQQTTNSYWLRAHTAHKPDIYCSALEQSLVIQDAARILSICYVDRGIADWDKFASLLAERGKDMQCLSMRQNYSWSRGLDAEQMREAFIRFVRKTQYRALVLCDSQSSFLDLSFSRLLEVQPPNSTYLYVLFRQRARQHQVDELNNKHLRVISLL